MTKTPCKLQVLIHRCKCFKHPCMYLYRLKFSHRSKYLNSPHRWPTDKASLILDVVMFGVQMLGSAHQYRNIRILVNLGWGYKIWLRLKTRIMFGSHFRIRPLKFMEGIQKICHHDISALSAQSEIRLRTRGIFDSGRGHPSFPCSCPVFQRSWGSKGR